MKKLLLETSFSKVYIIGIILVSVLIVGIYFSYAMFTVSKEKDDAIRIVTGNLTAKLEVDGKEGNTLTVPAGETKEFTVTLSNPNNRTARFNFYYEGSLSDGVTAGYLTGDGLNTPPESTGINLSQSGASGSSNIYSIRVSNKSGSSVTITLGVGVGLDYNDLTLPSNGHLFKEVSTLVSDVVIENLSGGSTYDDGIDTFIRGTDPNNYIWYSGKLWRAVSVANEARTTKLVTQWNISTLSYAKESTAFEGSYIEEWLNDTSVDGFLGNLREPEKFIVMDAKWDATMDDRDYGNFTRPNGTNVVTDPVGLLNVYECQASNSTNNFDASYLNNQLGWWTLTPKDSTSVYSGYKMFAGDFPANLTSSFIEFMTLGARPVINLQASVKIASGDGSVSNPYRLVGDNDTDLVGVKLNTRYSGEYVTFGSDENNLYRIVSHETDSLTKVTSVHPLKKDGTYVRKSFDDAKSINYSVNTTIGTFLNGEYLTTNIGTTNSNMIEDNTTWYLGAVNYNDSYKLAKYKDINDSSLTDKTTNAKVGLLRIGELMAGQFDLASNNTAYYPLTTINSENIHIIDTNGQTNGAMAESIASIKPAFNFKENVVITGGTGSKFDPFTITLAS